MHLSLASLSGPLYMSVAHITGHLSRTYLLTGTYQYLTVIHIMVTHMIGTNLTEAHLTVINLTGTHVHDCYQLDCDSPDWDPRVCYQVN